VSSRRIISGLIVAGISVLSRPPLCVEMNLDLWSSYRMESGKGQFGGED